MSINELQKGEEIIDFFLVKEQAIKEAANGKYLDLLLVDKTGEITAKMWRCDPDKVALIVRGTLVKVKGKVEEYRGALQLNIVQIRATLPEDGVDKGTFIKTAPLSGEVMYDTLMETIDSLTFDPIKTIVKQRVMEIKEELLYFPAAKSVHHSFIGGLLYHTLTMVTIGEKLLPIYPFLDRNILLAGIILHDLDKTEEMVADEFGVEDYTLKGNLLGHLVSGVTHIDRIGRAAGVDEEVIIILEHLVLSHHNKAEYGSPKPPALPEAELLHFIDNIDAKMNQYEQIYKKLEPGEFSERIFTLDNRFIYKPKWRQNNGI